MAEILMGAAILGFLALCVLVGYSCAVVSGKCDDAEGTR